MGKYLCSSREKYVCNSDFQFLAQYVAFFVTLVNFVRSMHINVHILEYM